ncbi:MAG: family 43 glycosylhydrolase [Bacteroidaceae bacterium]|nr:family 43 glycosylhydrolase [Bacteroidaceae bacterium]
MKGQTLLVGLTLLLAPLTLKAEGGKSQIPLADPYILLEGDTYYAYGTHDASGIRCYSSTDLRTWKDEGQALNKANTTETQWFWAPEVYHVKGQYIMYFSANEHLYAATATSPKGPFKQVGTYQMNNLIGDEKCIDSHVFIDEDSTAYIFFVRFTDGNCIWQAKLSDDFITPVEGTLRKCFAATQGWELMLGKVNEGPNVIKQGKRYFLTYSGNDYRSQDYAVGYATTTNIASGTWTKYTANPILRRWDDLVGTGHHSLFYDKEGILRIVFHAHNSTESVHDRLMYIGTMQFRGSTLVMLGDPIIRPTLSSTAPYSPELITKSWGFRNGGAVTVDLNNDGSQDIVTGGLSYVQDSATDETTSKHISYLAHLNATTHKWVKYSAPPFQVTESPSIIPCDINNDGNMDIIAFDQTADEADGITEGIFLGKGNGTFEEAQMQVTGDLWSMVSDIKAFSNAEVIDIDNDGRLDIILVGHEGERCCNVILHNLTTDLTGGLSFSAEPFETDFLLSQAIIQTADFNNDGFQDFVISALVDGKDDQLRFTDVYLNDSQQPGTFLRLGLGEKGADLKRKSDGALQVADFNDDGWPDIMLAGLGEVSSGESTTRQRIYINQQQTEKPAFKPINCDFQTDIYTLSSSASNSAGIIDWNGDGFYDIMLGGTKSNVYGGMLYLNDGKGRLKRSVAIPGATGASIIFPDYNGDGRKDFLLIGHSEDKNYLTAEQYGDNVILCCNLLPVPSRPDAPTAPTVTKQTDGITLAWQPAETAHPGFTYEVFIKDEQGRLLNSTPAIVGGTKDGIRKLNRQGRVGNRTEWTFRPTQPGTYTWGVQAVDAAYTGSLFTEGPQFTVTEEDIPSSIKAAPLQLPQRGEPVYNLAGQRLSKRHKGINIRKEKKILY